MSHEKSTESGPEGRPLGEEDLLRHGGFLERLARSLVSDEHEREDLVQAAWATALARPPLRIEGPGSLRAWLGSVLRNTASKARRDGDRRLAREREVARPEVEEPSVDDQLEVQAAVVAAVRELREPYRTAVHLRYFRDLAPSEIARRLGVPVATVDTRLARGRRMLREALLRAEGGDPRRLLAVLVPLARKSPTPSGAAPPPAPGAGTLAPLAGALVGMKLQIALAASVAAVLATFWMSGGTGEPVRPDVAPPQLARSAVELAEEPEVAGPARALESARRQVEAAPSAAAPEPEAVEPGPAAGLSLVGRLIDVNGVPIPAARVRFRPGEDEPGPGASGPGASGSREPIVAVTDRNGRFEMLVPGGGSVRTDQEGIVTVLDADFEGEGYAREAVVVAAPERQLEVRVTDPAGLPVAGARVHVAPPGELRSQLSADLDSSSNVIHRSTTDERGLVRFESVAGIEGLLLTVRCDGHRPAEEALEAFDLAGVGPIRRTLVLEPATKGLALRGFVIDGRGEPLADVVVNLGLHDTRTAADGTFAFDLTDGDMFQVWGEEDSTYDVVAARPGFLPAVYRPELDALGEPLWPAEVVLQITEACHSIAGRVVDRDGEPLAGWLVFLPEAHLFASGKTLEGTLAGDLDQFLHSVRTDERGGFELGGLLDEGYDLVALEPGTLQSGRLDSVAAGTRNALLVVDTSALWARVSGRVVDRSGRPLEGVVLEPFATTQTARGPHGVWSTSEALEPVTSDEEGRFTLRSIPHGASLRFRHPEILHDQLGSLREAGREVGDSLVDVEVEVTRRLRLQVVLEAPGSADEFRVLDGAGEELWLYTQTGSSYLVQDANGRLVEGRSRHLFVEETARVLVLRKDGEEVRRIPLQLAPGEENVLRL